MKGDGRDPRPMLAIFAVLVVAALGSAVSSIRLDHLLASAASLAPFVLGAIAIALALAPQRFLATRRALAARATVAVIPADEFDPKPETVLRFAAELARADRSLRGWLDRRAQALRVRLTNDREGRLVYLLEVPDRSRGLLRTALRDYEGAELREVTDVLAPSKQVPGKTVRLRTELVFHPLPESVFESLLALIAHGRDPEAGWEVEVQNFIAAACVRRGLIVLMAAGVPPHPGDEVAVFDFQTCDQPENRVETRKPPALQLADLDAIHPDALSERFLG